MYTVRPGFTEDDAALVGRHEQRVVDVQFEVVLCGQLFGFREEDTRKIGYRASCAVARGYLHHKVSHEGQGQHNGDDEKEVPGKTIRAQSLPQGCIGFLCHNCKRLQIGCVGYFGAFW